MSDEVDYVITDKEWNDDFAKVKLCYFIKNIELFFKMIYFQAKKDNPQIIIVNEDWLEACGRRKKLVDYKPYEVKSD